LVNTRYRLLTNSYDLSRVKATIYAVPSALPNRIAIVARPCGGDWLCDELSALSREGIDVLVSMLTDEESNELGLDRESEECSTAAIRFFNIPIPDRSVPADKDDFLGSVEKLADMVKEGRFLGVHCRASIGRSSVLVVSILVRLGWHPNDAFDAVESARGCSIPDTLEQRQWVIQNVPAPHET
jgi:protein-tyrosine phosphatase